MLEFDLMSFHSLLCQSQLMIASSKMVSNINKSMQHLVIFPHLPFTLSRKLSSKTALWEPLASFGFGFFSFSISVLSLKFIPN